MKLTNLKGCYVGDLNGVPCIRREDHSVLAVILPGIAEIEEKVGRALYFETEASRGNVSSEEAEAIVAALNE